MEKRGEERRKELLLKRQKNMYQSFGKMKEREEEKKKDSRSVDQQTVFPHDSLTHSLFQPRKQVNTYSHNSLVKMTMVRIFSRKSVEKRENQKGINERKVTKKEERVTNWRQLLTSSSLSG